MALKILSKKSVVMAAALAGFMTTPQTRAHVESGTPCFKTGFYLGALTGLSKMKVKVDSTFDEAPGASVPSSERQRQSDRQVVLDGLVGARYLFNNGFMPGIEVVASFAKHDIEARFAHGPYFPPPGTQALRVSLSRKNTLVPSMVLGWVVGNKFYIFGKLGVGFSQFKSTVLNPNPQETIFTQRKSVCSFVPSFGLEYSITPTFSGIVSVGWENYGKVTHVESNLLSPPLVATDVNTIINKFSSSIVTGKVGFIFKI